MYFFEKLLNFGQNQAGIQLNSSLIKLRNFKKLQNYFMSVQKNQFPSEVKTLCKDCNAFFGCQAFQGFCSSCFKKNQPELKNQRKQSTETNVSTTISKVEFIKQVNGIEQIVEKKSQKPEKQQKDKKRCFTCNKKVGLLGIECKCSFVFCNGHRLPQEHECDFNHKQQAKKRLQTQLIKCDHQKIKQI